MTSDRLTPLSPHEVDTVEAALRGLPGLASAQELGDVLGVDPGVVELALDVLVGRGAVYRVRPARGGPARFASHLAPPAAARPVTGPRPEQPRRRVASERPARPVRARPLGQDEVRNLIDQLVKPECRRRADEPDLQDPRPGVYAWWVAGPREVEDLGLTEEGQRHPLYVGRAGALGARLEQHRRSFTDMSAPLYEYLAFARDALPWFWTPRDSLYGYARGALRSWIGRLEVSRVATASAAHAKTLEDWAIPTLRPLINVAGMAAEPAFELWDADLALTTPLAEKAHWRRAWVDHWAGWAAENQGLLAGLTGARGLVIRYDDDFRPIRTQPIGPGFVDRPGLLAVHGEWFHPLEERLIEAMPAAWSLWQSRYGQPPSWSDFVASLSVEERRLLVLRRRLADHPAAGRRPDLLLRGAPVWQPRRVALEN